MFAPRLNIVNLFFLQLFVAPAFLGPLYYEMPWRNRPLVMFVTLLLAPTSYVAVFTYRATVRSLTKPSTNNRSIVFTSVRWGVAFGLLFGSLLVASLAVPWFSELLPAIFAGEALAPGDVRALRRAAWEGLIAPPFILVHYLLIGAATGGLVGMAVDAGGRCRSAQLITGDRNPNA
jgi:hypothetical protein